MKDVGDGEIVLEGANDEDHRSEKYRSENRDARPASGFAKALGTLILAEQRKQSCQERVSAQRQSEKKNEAANLRHVGESWGYFFKKLRPRQRPEPPGTTH